MAEKYFVIFDRQTQSMGAPNAETTFLTEGKLVPQNERSNPEICRVVRLDAASVKEAQEGIAKLFPGQNTSTPVVVTTTQYKES